MLVEHKYAILAYKLYVYIKGSNTDIVICTRLTVTEDTFLNNFFKGCVGELDHSKGEFQG